MKKLLILISVVILLSGCVKAKKEEEKLPEVYFPTSEEIKESGISEEKEIKDELPEEKVVDVKKEEKIEEKPKEKEIVLLPKKEPVPSPKKEVVAPILPKIFLNKWNGECLIYSVKWNSVNLGKAIFLCVEEKDYYRLIGITIPQGLTERMGYGYNRGDSFIDKKTGKTRYFYLYSRTGKKEKTTELFFNWSANQYTTIEKVLKDKKLISIKRNVINFEGDIFDCILFFYLIRDLNLKDLQGKEFQIALSEKWFFKINFKEKGIKNIPTGEIKEVVILEPFLRSEKENFKTSRFSIWITNDGEKQPI
ncbi:MAG: DUF3108 domain-containing protein, partial [Candidatus Omnitrophica bacterium]|nr:DUF3108 domain-containing protein [Candidatus Omnitrophota bacterium]